MPITSWTPERIIKRALDAEEKRMQVACVFVVGQVKRSINRGNPTGKNPSKPGEPPKKVSTRLFGSITHRILRGPYTVIGIIGTNIPYGRRLEYGFTGRDRLGRVFDMKPRPFLRPAVANNLIQIKQILGSK